MASIDDVLDISPRVQYTATASQTVFAYPFPIFVDANLVVDIDGVIKVLTTDYTVSGAGDETGGNVTLIVGATVNATVTIYRDISIERSTDFQQNGPWSSTSFNDELDKLTLILQELENKIGRSIRFPITSLSTNAEAEMDPIADFFGKFLRISATGILEAIAVSDGQVTTAALINLLDTASNYVGNDAELALAEIFETPSATTRRLVELATQAEVDTGTDAVRVVTPLTLKNSPSGIKTGTWTPTTYTGFSSDPTFVLHYQILDKVVTVWVFSGNNTGTSDATGFTWDFSGGHPTEIAPATASSCTTSVIDNSSNEGGHITISSAGLFQVQLADGTQWTASGNKGLQGGATFSYNLD